MLAHLAAAPLFQTDILFCLLSKHLEFIKLLFYAFAFVVFIPSVISYELCDVVHFTTCVGILLLLVLPWRHSYVFWDLQICLIWLGSMRLKRTWSRSTPPSTCLKRNYNLSKDIYDPCDSTRLEQLNRYIHRSSRHYNVSYLSSSFSVLTCWRKVRRWSHSGIDYANLSSLPSEMNSCAAVSTRCCTIKCAFYEQWSFASIWLFFWQ